MIARAIAAVLLVLAGCAASGEDAPMTVEDIVQRIETSPLQPEINAIVELELVAPERLDADDYRITPAARPFAADGAGGIYHLLPDGRVLLVDSEGSFGVVAANFGEFVGIVTGLAGWRDALRFVGEPDAVKARAAWEAMAEQWGLVDALDEPWEYEPEGFSTPTPRAGRERIRREFNVAALDDPFAALHRAVNGSRDVSVSHNNEPLLLFGRE